ncbi:hypothetical protein AB1L30_18000 [Bremerella sp. JC817]|uniref:NrdR family transcriptional regulator n=1 Tax=Bremerella sp. JC817 TaxID=3231756 RepID=UPI00345A35B5
MAPRQKKAPATKSPPPQPAGVACPQCGSGYAPVYYTRQQMGKTVRVRECQHCGRRFSTVERVA